RVRHRFPPARHDDVEVPGTDHRVGDLDGAEGRGAHLVDRVGRHLLRQACADRRLARRGLARARLQDLAHDHVLDVAWSEPRTIERGANRDRAELGRLEAREPAAEPPERRPNRSDDDRAPSHAPSVARPQWATSAQTACSTLPLMSLASTVNAYVVRAAGVTSIGNAIVPSIPSGIAGWPIAISFPAA